MTSQRMTLRINGKSFDVEVGDLKSSPVSVLVNGEAYLVEVQKPEAATTTPEITVQRSPVGELAGRPATAAVSSRTEAANSNEALVKAPMPGKILDIAVKAGDKVERGDPLCALEAMKMKSAIRSPRAGEIASVEVTEGQKVLYGDILVRFK